MENVDFTKKEFILRKKHDEKSFIEFLRDIPKGFTGIFANTIDTDTIGNSLAHPRWVDAVEYKDGDSIKNGIAIYKEPDYDEVNGPYAEKLWSILGKMLLPNCRIPDIEIIDDKRYPGIPGTLSYSIVDKKNEDMMEIRTALRYSGITEKEMIKNDDKYYLEDILEYVRKFIDNDENYAKIEPEMVKTVLLDCMVNTLDRHPDNWALVRDNKTNKYQLGVYDNTVSFINMLDQRPGVVVDGNWGQVFIKVKNAF